MLGAVRKQAIIWANVDSDLSRHMVSLGNNGAKTQTDVQCTPLINGVGIEMLPWRRDIVYLWP